VYERYTSPNRKSERETITDAAEMLVDALVAERSK
jgi:hypothetical protein